MSVEDSFYGAFFAKAVANQPYLARKMLDKQRKFLHAKGTSKMYSYDFSLLGTLAVTTGLRSIVENDRADLVVHDVVVRPLLLCRVAPPCLTLDACAHACAHVRAAILGERQMGRDYQARSDARTGAAPRLSRVLLLLVAVRRRR